MTREDVIRRATVLGVMLIISGAWAAPANAESSGESERFRGVTVNMVPEGLTVRVDVLRWSSPEEREKLVAALAGAGGEEDLLSDLPTLGYVWPDGSPLGYALKYTHRVSTDDGGELITLVTDRPLGKFDREPWRVADAGAPATQEAFTVLELRLDGEGRGTGMMSLAAPVSVPPGGHVVTLDVSSATPVLLDPVTREPKAY